MPLPDWLKQGDPEQPTPSPRKPPKAEKSKQAAPPDAAEDSPPSGGAEPQDLKTDVEAEPAPAEAETSKSPPSAKPSAAPKTTKKAGSKKAAKKPRTKKSKSKPKSPAPAADEGEQVLDMLAAIEQKLEQIGGSPGSGSGSGSGEERPTMAELEERERELHSMRKRMKELETQVQAAGRASDEDAQDLGRKLAEAQAEIEDLVRQAESTHAELEQKDEQLKEASQRIETLETQLQQQLDQGGETPAAPGATQGGDGSAVIERQREQIERLTEQLAEYQVDASPAEIRERDARIAELEEQIETLQGEGGAKPGVSKLVAGLGGALKRDKKEGRAQSDGGEIEALQEQIETLTAERETLKAQVQQYEAGDTGEGGAEVAALQQRVAELERELAEGGSLDADEATQVLQKELAQAKADARQAEIKSRDADQMREEIVKLRRALGARRRGSGAAGMGTSGRERTVVIFSCLVGLAIVAMILSGLAANKFSPATVTASVNIEAKRPNGGLVSDEDAAKWEHWHRAMLEEPSLHQKIAKRLADQRIDAYATPDAIAKRLDDDLSIDSPRPGALTLTLAGTDRGDLGTILDSVATTLALESSHSVGKRSDGSVAVVRGERQEAGRIRYASYNHPPIKDHRLVVGTVFFVFIFVIFVFVMSRIYQGVRSTREVMEEDPYDSVAREI